MLNWGGAAVALWNMCRTTWVFCSVLAPEQNVPSICCLTFCGLLFSLRSLLTSLIYFTLRPKCSLWNPKRLSNMAHKSIRVDMVTDRQSESSNRRIG